VSVFCTVSFGFTSSDEGGFEELRESFCKRGYGCLASPRLPLEPDYSRFKLFDGFSLPVNQFCLFGDDRCLYLPTMDLFNNLFY
jgi:hypothetical protein